MAFKRINLKEVEADELCLEIAREDIYRITLAQEDSSNFFKNIAGRTRVSDITHIRFPALKMIHNVKEMAYLTGEMILSTGLSELQDVEATN